MQLSLNEVVLHLREFSCFWCAKHVIVGVVENFGRVLLVITEGRDNK